MAPGADARAVWRCDRGKEALRGAGRRRSRPPVRAPSGLLPSSKAQVDIALPASKRFQCARIVRAGRWKDPAPVTRLLLAYDEWSSVRDLILGADWASPEVIREAAVLSQHLWLVGEVEEARGGWWNWRCRWHPVASAALLEGQHFCVTSGGRRGRRGVRGMPGPEPDRPLCALVARAAQQVLASRRQDRKDPRRNRRLRPRWRRGAVPAVRIVQGI